MMKKFTILTMIIIAMQTYAKAQVLQRISGAGVNMKIAKIDSVLLVPRFAANPPIKRLLPTLDSVGAIYYNPTDSTYYGMANSQWRPISSTGTPTNIYTANGTLLANRTVTGAGKSLTFTGLSGFTIAGVDALVNGLTFGRGSGNIPENTVAGRDALTANTLGAYNVAVGTRSLQYNATGIHNTAIGVSTLTGNITGSLNTAIGSNALLNNIAGWYNVAVGYRSLWENDASYNTAIGVESLSKNTVGVENTALGYQALYSNTTGSDNMALGVGALKLNTTGANNVAVGTSAMLVGTANGNTAIGVNSLRAVTGDNNTAVGFQSDITLTSGTNNIRIGVGGTGVTTGDNNVLIGDFTSTLPAATSNHVEIRDGDGNLAFKRDINNKTRISVQALQVVTVSAAGTLTLDAESSDYVFSGTTTTWTLPPLTGYTNVKYFIKNRGTGAITLNSNAGGNDIYTTSAVNTFTINAGSAYILMNDGTYWDVE